MPGTERLAVFLHQTASLIGSRRFLALFHSAESRFSHKAETAAVLEKLRNTLRFQVNQGLRSETLAAPIKARELTDAQAFAALAKQLAKTAGSLEGRTPVPAKHKRFQVARGEDVFDAIYRRFSHEACDAVAGQLAKVHPRGCGETLFEERNVLASIGCFIESLHTLRRPGPSAGYDRLLERQLGVPGWFSGGYAHDLLVHDKLAVRHGRAERIQFRPDWCSTWVLGKSDKVDDGWMVANV